MILGLCSSFAMVPALSVVTGGNPTRLRSVGPAHELGGARDPTATDTDPVSLAAILTSDASLSAMSRRLQARRLAAAPVAPAAAAAPVAPAAAAAPVVRASGGRLQQHGIASWLDISAGTCANNAAPMGAVITVTSSAGLSVTCKVVSRGPFMEGRIVDLARATFARLQLPARGLVDVAVSW